MSTCTKERGNPELNVQVWPVKITAIGTEAIYSVAVPVGLLLVAIAIRIVMSG
jgi:hypothetical protein